MSKEKFIQKILKETYDMELFKFSNFTTEKMLIKKAMQYRNWWMFAYGLIIGVFINIIIDFIIL